MLSLIRANVGATADKNFNKLFVSRYAVPTNLAAITPIERSFQDSAAAAVGIVLDDFDKPTGTSSAGQNESSGVTLTHGTVGNRHDPSLRGAAISWTAAGATTYFQSNFTAAGTGRDVTPYAYLNLRVARQNSTNNPATPTRRTSRSSSSMPRATSQRRSPSATTCGSPARSAAQQACTSFCRARRSR